MSGLLTRLSLAWFALRRQEFYWQDRTAARRPRTVAWPPRAQNIYILGTQREANDVERALSISLPISARAPRMRPSVFVGD